MTRNPCHVARPLCLVSRITVHESQVTGLGFAKVKTFCIATTVLLFCAGIASPLDAAGDTGMFTDAWFADQIKQGIRAPEFTPGLQWLNTGGRELHFNFNKELKGRIVIIDFWTYCCINCMHVLPDLAFLEDKYAGKPVVIIGCHSAKFNNEQETINIRQAILRYNIRHPVVVDEKLKIWDSFGVASWPTLVAVGPDGLILGGFSGEGHRVELDGLISGALAYYGKKNALAGSGLIFPLELTKENPSELLYPGKVLIDPSQKRLFISDSNHNRIVVTGLDGEALFSIGSGKAGARDGSFAEAQFNRPQGMALKDGVLYIADTENHLLRAARLDNKTVQTVAGTGAQAREYFKTGIGIPLSSPWDLTAVGNTLYIAMAGMHQIWAMDLQTRAVSTYAGSGREACIDGPRLQAAFAQPSGLSFDGRYLYVADSEVSSIRRLDLQQDGNIETVAGSQDLFGFGLKDGKGTAALLQHPLGVLAYDNYVFIADTYNHAIRRIDRSGTVETILQDGQSAHRTLYEPGGIAGYNNKLYIADTNNNRIQVFDLQTKKSAPLALNEAVPARKPGEAEDIVGPNAVHHEGLRTVLKPGVPGELRITLLLPPQNHLLAGYQARYLIKTGSSAVLTIAENICSGKIDHLQISVPFSAGLSGSWQIEVQAVYGYCNDRDKLCIPRDVVWKIDGTIDQKEGVPVIELVDKP